MQNSTCNKIKLKQLLKISIALSVFNLLTPLTVYAIGNDSSTTDPQSIGMTVDEQTLSHTVNQVLSAQLPNGSFTIASYGKEVLLAGQVPSALDKTKAEDATINTAGVIKVWNYLTVESNEDSAAIAHDAYLTSKARTRLVAQNGVNTNNIKVVTSNKVVYLLGQDAGKSRHIKAAIVGIRKIEGVKKVVNLIGQ